MLVWSQGADQGAGQAAGGARSALQQDGAVTVLLSAKTKQSAMEIRVGVVRRSRAVDARRIPCGMRERKYASVPKHARKVRAETRRSTMREARAETRGFAWGGVLERRLHSAQKGACLAGTCGSMGDWGTRVKSPMLASISLFGCLFVC